MGVSKEEEQKSSTSSLLTPIALSHSKHGNKFYAIYIKQ